MMVLVFRMVVVALLAGCPFVLEDAVVLLSLQMAREVVCGSEEAVRLFSTIKIPFRHRRPILVPTASLCKGRVNF